MQIEHVLISIVHLIPEKQCLKVTLFMPTEAFEEYVKFLVLHIYTSVCYY